jgi:hypothetical protein
VGADRRDKGCSRHVGSQRSSLGRRQSQRRPWASSLGGGSKWRCPEEAGPSSCSPEVWHRWGGVLEVLGTAPGDLMDTSKSIHVTRRLCSTSHVVWSVSHLPLTKRSRV